jgi:hypothetical protein
MIDSNTPNTLHQNLPPPHPPLDIPTSSDSRLPPRWVPSFTTTIPIQEPRAETSPPTPISSRETSTPPLTRFRLLRWHSISMRWISWILDEMVSRLARSMGLGSNVYSRRQKVVDTSSPTCLLGITSCYISSWMESTIGKSKTT